MSLVIAFLFFLVTFQHDLCESVDDGTELVLAFMIHRHGDRTPTESSVSYSNDPNALKKLIAPYGYGQLTERGIQRGWELGKFLRHRYNKQLAPKYNKSEVYIRSTDFTRTKMTALAVMAAVFPPNKRRWNPELNWAPTPYTTVPAKYDFTLAMFNCPTFLSEYYAAFNTEQPDMVAQFPQVYETLADLGFNITSTPTLVMNIYDLYIAQLGLGLALDSSIEAIFDEVASAAGVAWDKVFGDDNNVALQSGVLLNEFFTKSDTAISGDWTETIRIYSAHDATVYPFVAVTRATPRPGAPKYGALYSLELRKVTKTGQYVVLPVYVKSPGDDETYLQIEGCDDLLCGYDKFKEITSSYVLEEDDWKTKCGFVSSGVIDTRGID